MFFRTCVTITFFCLAFSFPIHALAPQSLNVIYRQTLQTPYDIWLFDVDETLTNASTKKISSSLFDRLIYLLAKGQTVVLISGRSFATSEKEKQSTKRYGLYDCYQDFVQHAQEQRYPDFAITFLLSRLYVAPEQGAYLVHTADLWKKSLNDILDPNVTAQDQDLLDIKQLYKQHTLQALHFFSLDLQKELKQQLEKQYQGLIVSFKPSGYTFSIRCPVDASEPTLTEIRNSIVSFFRSKDFTIEKDYLVNRMDEKHKTIFMPCIQGLDKARIINDVFRIEDPKAQIIAFGDQADLHGNDHSMLNAANAGIAVKHYDSSSSQIPLGNMNPQLSSDAVTDLMLREWIACHEHVSSQELFSHSPLQDQLNRTA